jgi:hypothetical protein
MAGLEELMAGLFGGTQAPAGDEMRRRQRGGPGGGGYEGIGGAAVLPGMMNARYGGADRYDFSGAMGRDFAGDGGRGLMSLLGGQDFSGPAMRHFANQGFDFGRPGQDNRERPGGPNIAPGNIDNGQALFQPQGPQHVPGIPQGVAVGQVPGEMRPRPQTQGWRNLAPGYSAAAQFGTDEMGRPMGFGGRPQQGAPASVSQPPAGGGGGGGRPSGGGGGAGPVSQNPIGGGGGPVAPAGPTGGGGAQGTGGGGGGGGKKTGGAPAGVTPQVKQQAAGQSTARGGTGGANFAVPDNAGGVKGAKPKVNKAYDVVQAGGNPFMDTINVAPNGGNNNTPSEVGPSTPGKLEGLSAKEKAARKSAWEAKVAAKQERRATRQEAQRQSVAQKSGRYAAPDPRGMGTDPLPNAGKTRPSKREVAARKGRAV